MQIGIVCSSHDHPVNSWLERWANKQRARHGVQVARKVAELAGGDILFLISCNEMVRATDRGKYRHCLVLHASDLPHGRGWSPHVWGVIEGRSEITISLLEAKDPVDTGDIWHQVKILLDGTELYDEINTKLFDAEVELMDWALENEPNPRPQRSGGTYYRKRTPADSEIDTEKPIGEVFDLLRVCDPDRFPAWFEHRGQRYAIELKKLAG